jgi:hypothetical protein
VTRGWRTWSRGAGRPCTRTSSGTSTTASHETRTRTRICLGQRCLIKRWTVFLSIFWRRDQSRRFCFSDSNLPLVAYCKSNLLLILL